MPRVTHCICGPDSVDGGFVEEIATYCAKIGSVKIEQEVNSDGKKSLL